MQMIRSGDNRKTKLLSQLDQKIFFSVPHRGDEVVIFLTEIRRFLLSTEDLTVNIEID